MVNEHDRYPQTYHCRLIQEDLFVLDDRGAEDNARHALQTVYHFLCSEFFLRQTRVRKGQGVSTMTLQNAEVRDAPGT